MNKFIFHNVGQGLFYSGSLNNGSFNFVYDCGSSSNSKYINKAIDNLSTNKVIDFVIISHLHADHISGLKRLFEKYRIKKIYLPYLGRYNNNLVKLIVAYSLLSTKIGRSSEEIDKTSRSANQSQNLEDYDFITSLYDVEEKRMRRDFAVEFIGEEVETSTKRSNDMMVSSEIAFTSGSGTGLWEFIMMNLRQPDSKLKQLNIQIEDALIKLGNLNIDDLIRSNRTAIITKIYNTVFKGLDINLTSTVLIHYPSSNVEWDCKTKYLYPSIDHTLILKVKPITILSGDALFDSELLSKLIKELKKYPLSYKIFQVPHHGGIDNWNSLTSTYKSFFSFYVIPFGLGNSYRHPHKDVINELTTKKANSIALVTELFPYEYEMGPK